VERGLAVLRVLALAPAGRLRPGDLVRSTGLARSTVDRVVRTLTHLGYLREELGRDLVLAPRALEPGLAYLRACRLPEVLGPFAEALADDLDESVSVAVPDRDAVRFVIQTPRRRALSVVFRAGDALPAERCAPGALFAAGWDASQFEHWHARTLADPDDSAFPAIPRIQRPQGPSLKEFRALAAEAGRRGWAVDDQLVEPGLVAVAVPVRTGSGDVVCALSVASHSSRHSAASLRARALKPMLRTARQMSRALAVPGEHLAAPVPERDTSLDPKQELGPDYLQSLARGLSVLAALSAPGGMTLSAVAEATALPRATARRCLLTLESLGYIAHDGRLFVPLPRVLELGYSAVSSRPLPDLAQPHLVDLVHRVLESASVAVVDGREIRYVARVAASRIMHVDITVGTRFPAHATSMGRVLLAGLSAEQRSAWLAEADLTALTSHTLTDAARLQAALADVERDGYAVVDQELEEGLRSVAVPLRGPDGQVIAAVNIAHHTGRTSMREVHELLLPALREAARRIEDDIALAFAFRRS
jgi:IclR family pca regulon transcriptional regulator